MYINKSHLLSPFGVCMCLLLQFKVAIISLVFKIITIVVVLGPFGHARECPTTDLESSNFSQCPVLKTKEKFPVYSFEDKAQSSFLGLGKHMLKALYENCKAKLGLVLCKASLFKCSASVVLGKAEGRETGALSSAWLYSQLWQEPGPECFSLLSAVSSSYHASPPLCALPALAPPSGFIRALGSD